MYGILNSVEYFIKDYIDKSDNEEYLEYEQLYNLYNNYCEEQEMIVEHKIKFTKEFKKIGSEKIDTNRNGKRFLYLKGVRLKKNIIKSIIPRYKFPDRNDRDRICDFTDGFNLDDIETPIKREDLYLIYSNWCNLKNYIPVDKHDFKYSIVISPKLKLKHFEITK